MLEEPSPWCRSYDLADLRSRHAGDGGVEQQPEIHQRRALDALARWYREAATPRGSILVLPTGAGKTFVAIRFLCEHPLSDGYKVLWLAHTHHLLVQAFKAFAPGAAWIHEPRERLKTRVVSGTTGHFRAAEIQDTDDVIFATLQTVARAHQESHPSLQAFLASARGKLAVVFDEAHHSPAPSYRRLIVGLQEANPSLLLLGLTATPTYTDETKRAWLPKLFPQGIVHQEEASALMAQGILARPVVERPVNTQFRPTFDARDYQKWVNTSQEIPERVIEQLANSRERNACIASTYLAERKKYGKTIIFADRWFQCEAIRDFLAAGGVHADVIYSHIEGGPATAEGRNRRTQADNDKALDAFRRGETEVLVNVQMLTEGTDIPNTKTVFLTRQTTSSIRITQMVGRALRGRKFGGEKDEAYIVPFIDDWEHLISWATCDQFGKGLADESVPEYGTRPPLQIISIDLVRRLVEQMHSGVNVAPGPFLTLLPIGWYRVEYEAAVGESDDVEQVRRLVLVFESEKESYERLMASLGGQNLAEFADPRASLDQPEASEHIGALRKEHFADDRAHFGTNLRQDLFAIVRHFVQNDGEVPTFFAFSERENYDLDRIVKDLLERRLDRRQERQVLETEYRRRDCYWEVLYPRFDFFTSQYDACVSRWLGAETRGANPATDRPLYSLPEQFPDREPSTERKEQVKERDGRCLCCGDTNRRRFVVDHLRSKHMGGGHDLDNLQTLCNTCNGAKGIQEMNFRQSRPTLPAPRASFPDLTVPALPERRDAWAWEMFVRRSINAGIARIRPVLGLETSEQSEGVGA